MPIKGLTTGNSGAIPVYLGKLRKGGAKVGDRVGPDLKHFRFDGGPDTELTALFESVFGKEANNIPVYLPFQTADENFEAWKEAYVKSGMVHRCDGEYVWERDEQGALYQTDKLCPGNCKKVGRLQVIIPALAERGRFGITTVNTTSLYDIRTLSWQLARYEMLAGGNLRGIPFVLSRKPRDVVTSRPDGSKLRATKWLIEIDPSTEWVMRQFAAAQRLAFSSPGQQALLTDALHGIDATEEDDDDDEIIDVQTGEITSKAPTKPVASTPVPTLDPSRAKAIQAYTQASMKADEVGLTNRVKVDVLNGVSVDEIGAATKRLSTHLAFWRRFNELWEYHKQVESPNIVEGYPEDATAWTLEQLTQYAKDLDAMLKDHIEEVLPVTVILPDRDTKADAWMEVWRAKRLPF